METIEKRLVSLLAGEEGFAATVLFDCGEAGAILIDGRAAEIVVSAERAPADCRIIMSVETFRRILDGELNDTSAFMQGEMRLTGEISLATRISNLIRARTQTLNASAE